MQTTNFLLDNFLHTPPKDSAKSAALVDHNHQRQCGLHAGLCFFICGLIASIFFLAPLHAQQNKGKTLSVSDTRQPSSFPLVANGRSAPICFDTTEEKVVHIAAQAFQQDVKSVTGLSPLLDTMGQPAAISVIIGTLGKSRLVEDLIKSGKLNVAQIRGKWECFGLVVIDKPFGKSGQALVIVGSDARGTAFGVFELSKRMGVLPLYWWADVTPVQKKGLHISGDSYYSSSPSVKYRGIFINDEDWGLQPWAAKTFETETGDIGPKTYAKVFELLLRLKANLIWPAMHPSTRAFFHYPGNVTMAADYAITVGSSHAEPMLRNNVDEWKEKTMGPFNYISNRDSVQRYWRQRVQQSKGVNAVYTMGMRGVHDSKMEGVKSDKEAVTLLEQIIADQRELLRRYIASDVTAIPQVFTAYKEVLDVYDAGLKLPEDITLVWPDDNYGYILRLTNNEERRRTGGAGVYYHASYWGRPHDYLWLGSAHPALVQEEMTKAFASGADRLWILNVGDIKPLEYNIEQFLDMAYNVKPFEDSRYAKTHLSEWAASIFGQDKGEKIAGILWQYYRLAFERKPEFMGWSQIDPTTKTTPTAYNHFYYGDEAQKRLDAYEKLEQEVRLMRTTMEAQRAAPFYELVYYPVMAASWMNKKFLYRDKAALYTLQNRVSASDYAALSKAAYDSIVNETADYNSTLAGGKWKGMVSMKPRGLPVFAPPSFTDGKIDSSKTWNIAPEGLAIINTSGTNNSFSLPAFDDVHRQQYFVDVFLSSHRSLSWSAVAKQPWIFVSKTGGELTPKVSMNQVRLWVTIDWKKAPQQKTFSGQILFKANDEQIPLTLTATRRRTPELAGYHGFVENNGYLSFQAANFSAKSSRPGVAWTVVEGLGYSGKVLQLLPAVTATTPVVDTALLKKMSATVSYNFYSFTEDTASVTVFTLPTHPLNNKYSMRYAVSIDGGPLAVVDFKTAGRNETWKQNVLRNRAEQRVTLPQLKAGKHTLRFFAIDPGVALDEIRINLGGLKPAYSSLNETK